MAAPGQTSIPPAGSDIFGQYDSAVAFASAVILMLAISAIDKLTGFELRLQILYLIPVAIATWSAGRALGIALATASVGIWLATFASAHTYSKSLYYYWDGGVWFVTLVIFAVLIARLHDELETSNSDLVHVLEELDAPAYVADPRKNALLYGNRRFRDEFSAQSYEAVSARPAHEFSIGWPDGRHVVLRIIT